MRPAEQPDATPDGTWDGYPCRHWREQQPEHDESRWCHHCAARHRTDHDEHHPMGLAAHHPMDHDGHHRSAHRVGHAGDYHWCHHARARAPAAATLDDRESDAGRHRSRNPRCRHHRHRNHSSNQRTRVQWVRRPDEDATPIQWATRGRDAATHPSAVRSSAGEIRCRRRNSTGPHPGDRPARHRRNEVHRNRRHRRRNGRSHFGRPFGATCRRSSVPPALRPRAVLLLSCSRPDRSSRRDPG